MMSEHPELPDLIRKTGVPVPQVLDRSGETLAWKPAEDMAPKLDDLIEALGATAAKQDAAKGVLDAISTAVAARATEATLAAIKDALTDGSLKAQLSGSLVETDKLRSVKQAKMTIETVLNAQSVAAGTSIGAAVSGDGASQVWVMVNIDKQPWSAATGGGPHYFSGVFYDGLYPKRTDVTKAYTEGSEPAMSLVMPFAIGSFMGLTSPASWTEALLLAGTISDGVRLAVQNKHATDTATVTIKLVRMWR